MKKSLLLLGASGLVGGECLRRLLVEPGYERIVVFTRREGVIAPHPSLEIRMVDFDRPESYRAYTAVDQVICALGTTIAKAGSQEAFYRVDYTYPLEMARAARENGAEHFLLVSSSGADATSRIFYSRVKGEIEAAVQSLGYPAVSIFRPSLLLGERQEFRWKEELFKPLASLFNPLIPARYRPIHAGTVAAAILAAAQKAPSGVRIYESDEIQGHGKKEKDKG